MILLKTHQPVLCADLPGLLNTNHAFLTLRIIRTLKNIKALKECSNAKKRFIIFS